MKNEIDPKIEWANLKPKFETVTIRYGIGGQRLGTDLEFETDELQFKIIDNISKTEDGWRFPELEIGGWKFIGCAITNWSNEDGYFVIINVTDVLNKEDCEILSGSEERSRELPGLIVQGQVQYCLKSNKKLLAKFNKKPKLSTNLNKENFWDELYAKNTERVQDFCNWIDQYKKREDVMWDYLFQRGIKFHDIPLAMQLGILHQYISEKGIAYYPTPEDLKEVIVDVFNGIYF